MRRLKSSFNHSLTIKIGRVIADLCEENINPNVFPGAYEKPNVSRHVKLNSTNTPVKIAQRCSVKKVSLKNFATCLFAYYWNRYQVVDSNQSKSVKILISEKTSFFFNISLWKSLFSADQQSIKKMCWNGMVSTNNLQRIYSAHSPDLQTFLVEAMPRYVFD